LPHHPYVLVVIDFSSGVKVLHIAMRRLRAS
jgi:hypothetical protein